MTDWILADLWETIADVQPEAPAIVSGETRRSWKDFDRRADSLGSALLGTGCAHQSKIALYLYNIAEYLETVYACLKVGMVPVNTNYRYAGPELVYLWDNADAEVVVFDHRFSEQVEMIRQAADSVRLWVWVGPSDTPCPAWASRYEQLASRNVEKRTRGPWGRSGDDLLFIYTGGTTGSPKGVMWRQDDLFCVLNRTAELRYDEQATMEEVRDVLSSERRHPPPRLLPAPPLMHGTGLFTAISVLSSAGSIVLLPDAHLDIERLLDVMEAEKVTEIAIVGDAFGRPLLAALDSEPQRWRLSSLWLMISSGVMWSAEVKAGLLRHLPGLTMVDTLGSSESAGIARSYSKKGQDVSTASFLLGPSTRVIDEHGQDVDPGSNEPGMLIVRGRGPIGYYKDPEKSATVFREIDGERWTVVGDLALVTAEGEVQLVGRGSLCINTGGEKVFPEEVEEVLKQHPDVIDAAVLGIPDERFGESIAAVIARHPGSTNPDEKELASLVRGQLAAYKVPRRIVFVESLGRTPSGKLDYATLKGYL